MESEKNAMKNVCECAWNVTRIITVDDSKAPPGSGPADTQTFRGCVGGREMFEVDNNDALSDYSLMAIC